MSRERLQAAVADAALAEADAAARAEKTQQTWWEAQREAEHASDRLADAVRALREHDAAVPADPVAR